MRGEERRRATGAYPLGRVASWDDSAAQDDNAHDAHDVDVARLSTRYLPTRARPTGAGIPVARAGSPARARGAREDQPRRPDFGGAGGRSGVRQSAADPRATRTGMTGAHRTMPTAAVPGVTRGFPASIKTGTTARIPAVAAPRVQRVPARLPSVVGDDAPARLPVAARDRAVASFCEAETTKPRALPRGTTIIPVVTRPSGSQNTGLSRILAELEETPFWTPRRRRRPILHTLISLSAMMFAVVAVVGVLLLRAPSMPRTPDYAALTDSTGGQLGALYASSLASMPTGQALWEASASSVPVLGGGGASAPTTALSGGATATTAPAPTNPPTAKPAAPQPTAPATATPHPPAPAAPAAPAVKPQPTTPPPPPQPTAIPTGILPAPVSPWPPANPWMSVPGHSPYGMSEFAGDPYAGAFGQCTWWSQYERRDENLRGMGNARYWAGNAAARGLSVGNAPRVGATVVFQPGVQGAGWAGHVAHVLALYPGGWFLVSEMNSYGNGGGWGRVSFRYAHTGWGVQFIY